MGIQDRILAALGRNRTDSHGVALERVREAMLLVIDEYGGVGDHRRLEMKISAATEISELWHLRPDLMQVVAAERGEQVAQNSVGRITTLFRKHHLGGSTVR